MELEAALRDQVGQAIGRPVPDAPIKKLKGDASNRSYYRVGSAPESWVLMVMPPDATKKSEEATKGEPPKELPFVNVHRYLEKLGVRVPRILRYDEPAGIMVLEDLSDITFESALEGGRHNQALYTRAVDLLAKLRVQAEKQRDPECLAFTRAFDEDLYDWELHHFREWGLEAWSGKLPTDAERAELDATFRDIAKQLAAAPRGFTHRDYQSRNIMVKEGELVVIDFQDALQGPRQYDLVALLRDSYVELDRDFVDTMLDRYIATFEQESGEKIDAREFKAFFDLLTIQRKLKDAGRFEFINRVKGNPGFLVSIPASLRYVKAAFARRPELAPLQKLVAKYVPELAA
ncbi:phosphotransferase [Corallococcus exiguus]|uniref:aminoglycoside phosphotransferase family protein n=1 Tax=Corallococcus TaxID=83461 RepID=UPI000EA2A3FA|nr:MULTISPECIES: phosphotransferase [Corallococcus]RKI36326.1 aminoglycoside phosphotransferase [Corallococcus sp. AB004]MBN8466099.1 phosphotransferase [Corallococcus exiguus]NNC19391.1 phosphotransferase [Corallococcus exiguus]NPC73760.1 phosphotransferase [Corallococcus exiguus]NPD27008.1 phosphotransferase [Corallococcus exiguus]